MARGRPVLATFFITVGVIALAVPGSAAFAGEFLVLNGIFLHGWGWAVVGAIAIVLAAMYVLGSSRPCSTGSPGRRYPRRRSTCARWRSGSSARSSRSPRALVLAGGDHGAGVRREPDVNVESNFEDGGPLDGPGTEGAP